MTDSIKGKTGHKDLEHVLIFIFSFNKSLNITELSKSQLNKLKSGKQICTKVTLNLSSNLIGNSKDQYIFPHKLLLTNRQVQWLHKAFMNNSSANIKLSKTQLHKIGQSVEFLGRFLRPLLKTGLPLTKNTFQPLTKSDSIPT